MLTCACYYTDMESFSSNTKAQVTASATAELSDASLRYFSVVWWCGGIEDA